MKYTVTFPGGMRVNAQYRNHTIETDQPIQAGGTDTAPSPFELFLASLATCAGFYALRFCQQRQLSTEGLAVSLDPMRDAATHAMATIRIELTLPDAFPDKYRDAILRAVDQCAVKRTVVTPPQFEIAIGEAVHA